LAEIFKMLYNGVCYSLPLFVLGSKVVYKNKSRVSGGIEVLYCHHSNYNLLSVYNYTICQTRDNTIRSQCA